MRFVACVVALSAVLGLTACGGDDDEAGSPATTSATTSVSTIPAAQYAKSADELCAQVATKVIDARIQQRLSRIERSNASEAERLAQATPVMAEQLRMVSDFARKVEQLGLPSAHRDDAELLLAKTRSAVKELGKALAFARKGDSENARHAIGRYAGFSSQSASIARDSELNFAICGAGA